MKAYQIFCVLLVLICSLPSLTDAADLDLEKDLQSSLDQSHALIKEALSKLREGRPITSELTGLETITEDIWALHLLFQERFGLRQKKVDSMGTKALSRHSVMLQDYMSVLEEYLALIDSLAPEETDPEPLLNQLETFLDNILYKKKPLIFGSLPYRNLNYPTKQPLETPSIAPAHKGGNKTVGPEDLKATLEAPITEEISALAWSLKWNPVSIYEWVKNNIETEWYWGCMKGAEETLRQKSGNDCDQAALLIALLRASGYPSRYVRGMIEFFPDITVLQNLTGIKDPQEIAVFFQKAGIPYKPVVAGGKITNVQIEHIWIETQVPFANFHGAVVDEYGKVWIGLDTSIKVSGYTYNDSKDILQEYSLSEVKTGYLSALRDQTPLEYIRTEIEANTSGTNYEEYLRTKTLSPEAMNILPASLQYKQVHVTHEYSEIPEELIHRVRFMAVDINHNELFDITLEALSLSNQEIALNYEPETVEDHEIMNTWGGLGNTPAYLVRLRPVLELNGETLVVSREGLPIGAEYDLSIELISPNGVETITNTHITGNYVVIGIVAQQGVPPEAISETEKDAWRLLYEEAISYIHQWNQAEEELAALMQLNIIRPIPTVVTLGGVLDVTYLLDLPHGVEWKGVYIDADLKAIEAVESLLSDTNNQRQKDFMRLSSLQGSILEHKIFEEDFQVTSISTAKLFQLANESQIPILFINKTNIDTALPPLPFAEGIKEDITNAVNQNLTVEIPQSEVMYEDWTGIGYIIEDQETGASGWMLSGRIAGGVTTEDIMKWLKKTLGDIFSKPFFEPPNYDPASAQYIYKIPWTDEQKGTVGEALSKKLQVLVFDKYGKPVKGAWVYFAVRAGDGTFIKDQETPAAMTMTGSDGIASVTFFPGKQTGENPTYLWEDGDTYSQQVGLNLIEASLDSGTRIRSPFVAYGLPKEPHKMKKVYGDEDWCDVLGWAGFVSVLIEDEYGNPISNLPIDFTVMPPTGPIEDCKDPRAALLIEGADPCLQDFPSYWTCKGKSAFQVITGPKGTALAYVLLGGTPGAGYPIKASYKSFSQIFTLHTFTIAPCLNPDPRLLIETVYATDSYGNNINAVQPGKPIPLKAKLVVLRRDGGGFIRDTNYQSPNVSFGGEQGQAVDGGVFTSTYKNVVGGINDINIKATAKVKDRTLSASTSIRIYGVEIKDLAMKDAETGTPVSVIPLDEYGYTEKDVKFTYTITPPEYVPLSAYFAIFKDDMPTHYYVLDTKGDFMFTLTKGSWFDIGQTYKAEVVLNTGSAHEIRSEKIVLPLGTQLNLATDLNLDGVINTSDETLEQSTWAYTGVNNDDDDLDGKVDLDEGQVLLIPGQSGSEDENDLKRFKISVAPSIIEQKKGKVTLQRNNGRVRVFKDPRKGIAFDNDQKILWSNSTIDYNPNDEGNGIRTWNLANDSERANLLGLISGGVLWVEGVENSSTLGDTSLKLSYFPDAPGTSIEDEIRITIVKIDLDTDANNDGKVDNTDELVEEYGPGKVVAYNDDDDNSNSMPDRDETTVNSENDLAVVKLAYAPATLPNGFKVVLKEKDDKNALQMWSTATKAVDTNILLPKTYIIGTDTIPATLYAEGYEHGEVRLDMVLKTDKDKEIYRDKNKLIVLSVDLRVDSNNDNQIDDTDDPVEGDAPGAVINLNDDDDDSNGIYDYLDTSQVNNEDDLAIVHLNHTTPQQVPTGFKILLETSQGANKIKVWKAATKGSSTDQITLPESYIVGHNTVPATLYLEGVKTGEAALDMVVKSDMGVEIYRDKVKLTIVEVFFSEHPNQSYGYDEIPSYWTGSLDEYISLSKDGTTQVNIKMYPFVPDVYWAATSDPAEFKLQASEAVKLTAPTSAVSLQGQNFGSPHESALLHVRRGSKNGPIVKSLHVELYEEKDIITASYYRVRDPAVAATTPQLNPPLELIKDLMNDAYKQAVIDVLYLNGDTDRTISYDQNHNGILDYYRDGGTNPEVDTITGAGLPGSPKFVYVRKMRCNWRLKNPVASGVLEIELVNASGIGKKNYTIGPAVGAGEPINITDISGNKIILNAPLSFAHAGNQTVYTGLAGLGDDPQFVTNDGGELLATIIHEMLHKPLFGKLSDVQENDNLMYWTTGGPAKKKLRYRAQTVVTTGTGVPTGTTENQWDLIPR